MCIALESMTIEFFFKTQTELANLPDFLANFAKFCQNLKSLKYIKIYQNLKFISF